MSPSPDDAGGGGGGGVYPGPCISPAIAAEDRTTLINKAAARFLSFLIVFSLWSRVVDSLNWLSTHIITLLASKLPKPWKGFYVNH